MDIRFGYETYQDVRHNLFLYSVPVLIFAGFFTYFAILPLGHRAAVTAAVLHVVRNPIWSKWVQGGASLVLFAIIAFLLTEIVQVHDQWYDKYVIKWRFRYATDFILPRLTRPFACHLGYRFYEAERNVGAFQERLFYPFVGDRDPKIPKNKLVRFYEVITLYWLTQLNELLILLMLIAAGVYQLAGPADPGYRTRLLRASLILVALLVANRAWIRSAREKTRSRTEDEILAIHENHLEDLQERLVKLCQDYHIPYEEKA